MNKKNKDNLIVICGPTSTGKTSLAVKLCKQYNGEIISADSRQIYKEMDIGTNKIPTTHEKSTTKKSSDHYALDDIVIWGYDLIGPNQNFSAYDFCEYARNKITEIIKKGKVPFLVGGTGFYIDATIGKIELTGIEPDHKLRKELETYTLKQLQEKLKRINLSEFKKIDTQNPARLIRSIEKSEAKNLSKKELPKLEVNKIIKIGLKSKRDLMYEKADKWLNHIWDNGLLKETKYLLNKYPNSKKLEGLIYKSSCDYVKTGETSVEKEQEAKDRAKFDIHAYIRRQQTWFKKDTEIEWFDSQDKDLYKKVESYINTRI